MRIKTVAVPEESYAMVETGDGEDAPTTISSAIPPCSVVWTPIPPITCCLPFVGHMGLTDSKGFLHDWHGDAITPTHPRNMLFGAPARYVRLATPADAAARERWDAAIARADDEYAHHLHVIVCGHDCHSHVARALNLMRYGGCAVHNKIFLAAGVFFCGRYVSTGAAARTWVPFLVVVAIVVVVHFT